MSARFELTLKVQPGKGKALLPLNYQYELSAWIYRVVKKGNEEFAAWLHDRGYGDSNKAFKLFSFSHLRVPAYRIREDRMELLCERLTCVISFCTADVIEPFVVGVFKNCVFTLGDARSRVAFRVEEVKTCPPVVFLGNMTFQALSPVFMDRHLQGRKASSTHLAPGEPFFEDLLHHNLVEKYRLLHEQLPPEDWVVTRFHLLSPPRPKMIAIKRFTPQATRLKCYFCSFELTGEPALLEIAYYAGIGRLNSQGFGCIGLLEK